MITALFILSLILVFLVIKLNYNLDEVKKTSQYNLEVFNQKFKDIEQAFDFEKEQRGYLLDQIHELEKENRKILD